MALRKINSIKNFGQHPLIWYGRLAANPVSRVSSNTDFSREADLARCRRP